MCQAWLAWAARYNTGLLNLLTPKDIVFSSLACYPTAPLRHSIPTQNLMLAAASDHDTAPFLQTSPPDRCCTSAAAAECRACHAGMARYHCSICQLFDDEPGRDIYHCPFCNLCRLGKGLGRDVRHCMQCNCCMDLAEFKQHKCRDLSTCPVCTEYLFDSNSPYRVSLSYC